jgi:hypothetical protein
MAVPVLAKVAAVAVPALVFGLVVTAKAEKKKAGEASGAKLRTKDAVVQAAQTGVADTLDALAKELGAPDNAIVGGVANRIRQRTTLSGFGPNLFDPGPDLAAGGRFKGGPSSGPLRELQGFLLTLQGDATSLVEWSMAMGSQGFAGYAGQLRAKAEGRPVVPLGSGGASPSSPSSPASPSSPGAPVVPSADELGARIAAALATQDPAVILTLADELDKLGQAAVAARLRQIANELQAAKRAADDAKKKAEDATKPGGPSSPGIPSPSSPSSPATPAGPPPANVTRRVQVLKGEGPFQVAVRLLGSDAGKKRWRELVAKNIPPKKRDKKTGGFTQLHPGEELFVPVSWPEHPDARRAGQPAPAPAPAPTPSNPTVPPPVVRRVAVKAGEGPFQVAVRLLGQQQGALRWKELVAANVPPKKRDAKTGGFTILNPGELLVVPEAWPFVP